MHHALLIPDIRAYIFASIKEDKLMGRHTLAMLARTCNDLSEASLDALWSELDSLGPLASCIYVANSVSLSVEPAAEANNYKTEPDLSVFYKYAHRVHKLDVSGQQRVLRRSGGYPSVTDDLGALLYYAVPSPLLPKLRHLAWTPGMSLNLLHHLLSPQLLSLKIPSNRWSPESTLFALTKIPSLCPNIKSLTLQSQWLDGNSPAFMHTEELAQRCVPGVICSWEKLEELDYNPTSREGILRLSVLSSLRILRLFLSSSSVIDLPSDSLSFPSLQTLQLQTDTLETAITLMRAVKGIPKSLKIDIFGGRYRRGSCNPEIVGVLLRLLSGDASHHKLRNFSMNFQFVLGDHPVNVSEMIRPLFPCCELRTLCIRMTSRFILDDEDLRMMAVAWPELQELELIDLRPRIVNPSSAPHQHPPPLLPIAAINPGQPNQFAQPPPPMPTAVSIFQPQTPQPPLIPVHVQHPAVPPMPVANLGQISQFLHLPIVPPPIAFPTVPPDHFFPIRSRTAEITFHGLISLLELCPSLYYFDLAIDATKLDGLRGDKPGGGVCNRLVKCARLIDSPVGDPEVVARVLLDILPELDTLVGSAAQLTTPPQTAPQGWLNVRQIILNSRDARRQLASQSV